MEKLTQKGFGHHFLLPILAVLLVGGIGLYLTLASKAAVPAATPQAKRGWVDDGPYAGRDGGGPSMTHDYTTNGASNPYYFALSDVGMRHVVLNVGVRELVTVNATTGATTYTTGSIEKRIANVLAWNAAHPDKKLTVHLRFHVGFRAPLEWKTMCGVVALKDPQGNVTSDTKVPRWWAYKNGVYTYQVLYKNAMVALAGAVKKINASPATYNIIGSVNAPGAAANYPEPFVLYGWSKENAAILMSRGFTAAEHDKFMKWFPTASAPFKGIVNVELALNPYQNLTSSGDIDKTKLTMYQTVATTFINTLRSNAVLANYSAREAYISPSGDPNYRNLYAWMVSTAKNKHVWIGLQLSRPNKVASGDPNVNEAWDNVAAWAANKGFNFVETSGPNVSPTQTGNANVWPEAYHNDSDDITTMKNLQTKLMLNPKQ